VFHGHELNISQRLLLSSFIRGGVALWRFYAFPSEWDWESIDCIRVVKAPVNKKPIAASLIRLNKETGRLLKPREKERDDRKRFY